MIEQIFVMHSSGVTLYQWRLLAETDEDPIEDDQLVAGFLTALNMFAESHRGQAIQELTLNQTNFLFEREQDLIFVITTTDEAIIPVVKLLLLDIKSAFLSLFPVETTPLDGNVSKYRIFTPKLLSVLSTYNILPLIDLESRFSTDPDLMSNLLLDRVKGDILFIHAKTYLDRTLLSFQTEIIFRAAHRLIEEKLGDEIHEIVAVSKSNRSFHLQVGIKTLLITEFHASHSSSFEFSELKVKQVQKRIRSPGKLIFEYEHPYLIVNDRGSSSLTNIKDPGIISKELGVDFLPIRQSFASIFQQIYRAELLTVFIIGQNQMYLIVPLTDYTAFLFVDLARCDDVSNLVERTTHFLQVESSQEEQDQIVCIFQKILQFTKFF